MKARPGPCQRKKMKVLNILEWKILRPIKDNERFRIRMYNELQDKNNKTAIRIDD